MNNYVPGFSNYLQTLAAGDSDALGGGYGLPAELTPAQRLPTAQPVQAVPADEGIDYVDLSKINLAGLNPLADAGPAYDPNMVYRFDTGSKIGAPKEGGGWDYQNAAPVVFQQGQQYVMVNPLNGNVIGRASTPEEMQKLVGLSSSNKDWQLYRANEEGGYTPGTQLFDRSNAGSLGSMLVNMGALALPAVGGAVLGPVLSGALGSSAAVGTGLGTALGSAASGVTAGKSLEDILKQAAIAGITAGGLQALAGGPTAAGGNANSGFVDDLVSMGVSPTTAANIAGSLGGALPTDIVVTGTGGAGALSGFGGSLANASTFTPNAPRQWSDYGDRVEQPQQDTQQPEDIVVTAAPKPTATGLPVPNFGSFAPSLTTPVSAPPATQAEPQKQSTISKIADYLDLAGMGIGALGSLFGGGQQTAAKIANAGGLGGLNPTFSAKLPGANIPGLPGGTGSGAPRSAATLAQQGMASPQDYYRYGYGPEQSFFDYVPMGAPNTSKAYTGYAKGGFAVEGPGDGREDKIPAMLSDGEYVIDAETVALLGNGSNKAGADMLDKFRVKVRKHKGRELARGKFSKNAKRPEQYLAGGRA